MAARERDSGRVDRVLAFLSRPRTRREVLEHFGGGARYVWAVANAASRKQVEKVKDESGVVRWVRVDDAGLGKPRPLRTSKQSQTTLQGFDLQWALLGPFRGLRSVGVRRHLL